MWAMPRRRRTPPDAPKPDLTTDPNYDWTADLAPTRPLEWETVQQVAAGMWRIRLALADYNNHRGEAVFALDNGAWLQIATARLKGGVPYGESDDGDTFVLRHVRVGKPAE